MIRNLLAVAVSGLAVCVICLSAAAAIGGKALRDAHYDFGGLFAGGDKCDFDPSGRQGSRSIAWNGGSEVAIAIPATVHYRPGTGDQVMITGDSGVISHIRLEDSTLKLDCNWRQSRSKLDVTLPGRPFQGFKISGAGSLTLDGIDQPNLKLELEGAGLINANGKTGNLDLEMQGAGEANLGALTANRVKVDMEGANNAEVAPKDDLNVEIEGMGNLKLLTEPHKIESDISGAGHITHPNELDKDD